MSLFSWLFGSDLRQKREIENLKIEVETLKKELIILANMTGALTADVEKLAKIFTENREGLGKLMQMYTELSYDYTIATSSLQMSSDDKNVSLSLPIKSGDDDDDLIN